MDANGILQIVVYVALIAALTAPMGGYMAAVFDGRRVPLTPLLAPVERGIYRLAGVDPGKEQHWSGYALSLLAFNLLGFLFLYAAQRLQGLLPLNPANLPGVAPDLAFNTAISFVTNTNWQSYGGESTMSYLTQMVGLTVQNFVSAATGIAVAIALVRGFARRQAKTLGNFYVDLIRATLYLLLPLCFLGAMVLVFLGVPENFSSYVEATTLEGAKQVIAQGPVASQMMIKHLGTNGGGFFNVNAAHPYENPSALVNLIHMLAIFAIGTGLTNTFGRMVGDTRQGWTLLLAMGLLFVAGVAVAYWAEAQANPVLSEMLAGPVNMEGKEVRFGIAASILFTAITTAASCGAVNVMHDSLMPLAGMVPLVNIMLGEVIVGGVGAGLYGMLLFVIVAVFIAGLMVGRTPEYLGKKIEAREVKLTVIALLALSACILCFGAAGLLLGSSSIQDAGPHGLTELIYAYVSATGNNGSAFAGFNANTPLHNTLLAFAMLFGRFVVIVPVLAIAGSVAAKVTVPASAGTFPTTGNLFVGLLIGVIVVVVGLTYFPILALGPIAEHLMLADKVLF